MTVMRSALLIYGSQTGQSQAIAEQIAVEAEDKGVELELLCGDEIVDTERLDNQVVVFVVSSTGEGDPPENFESLWASIHDRAPVNLTYTLLGLGDSNYTEFGGFPNALREALLGSQGQEFYEYQLADDQVGLELVVEPWIEGLWEPLKHTLTPTQPSLSLDPAFLTKLANLNIDKSVSKSKRMFDHELAECDFEHVFPHGVDKMLLPFKDGELERGEVVDKRCLVEESEMTKETWEIEVKCGEKYGPGDSFGVLCQNGEQEVWDLINRLKLREVAHRQYNLTPDPSVKPRLLPKHVLLQCSPYYALKYTLDIRSLPKKALLSYLAECCEDERDEDCLRYLASKEGSEDLNTMVYSRSLTLIELLSLFPSCTPSFCALLQHLPRLTPRYYSVSRVSAHGVKFVFNRITCRAEGELAEVRGVCSSWMRELQIGDHVWLYRRKNANFKPDVGAPVVMIGAGTGVSPFLGFLDYLAKSDTKTRAVLITGNRYKKLDSIYGEEFSGYHSDGTLESYLTAHSRDAHSTCKYVQDVIRKHALEISGLIDEGARLYVCGDAKGLSVGVFEMVCEVLAKFKGLSESDARDAVTAMKKEGRYNEDIWT